MKPVVLVGHRHECPLHGTNEVTSGVASVLFGARQVACVGDTTSCGARITSGASGVTVEGRQVACEGDRTDHGGTLVEGEPGVLID
ncbi:PAAR domain-containing protein [Stenotrophomonas bentonitica]